MKNKIALVTGAASGIGRDTALLLMERGCRVIGCDRNLAGMRDIGETASKNGWSFVPVELDLSDDSSFDTAVKQAEAEGRLDFLINCAGICSGTPLDEISPEEWDRTYAVNLRGPFFLTRRLMPMLEKGENPAIVNVSSMAGFTGGIQSNPAYSSSKAAVTCMTKNLAKFCAPRGIRVNEVAPGTARTAMTENWLGSEGLKEFEAKVPLGRLAQADDVAKVIVFLVSQEAGFITGQTVHVNGGMYIP